MARPSFRIGDLGIVVDETPKVIAESSFSVRPEAEPKDCIFDLFCKTDCRCKGHGCSDDCIPYGTACCTDSASKLYN